MVTWPMILGTTWEFFRPEGLVRYFLDLQEDDFESHVAQLGGIFQYLRFFQNPPGPGRCGVFLFSFF